MDISWKTKSANGYKAKSAVQAFSITPITHREPGFISKPLKGRSFALLAKFSTNFLPGGKININTLLRRVSN
jgi:hypothetical protein